MSLKVGKIRITLGLKADSSLPAIAPDTLGHICVGPQGLLTLLETQLGMPTLAVSFTTRLIQYLACIDQLKQATAFYHASYQADPFSVARTLLQWRDHWYLSGWQGQFAAGVSGRLADMAAIEQSATGSVAPNIGQRVQTVIGLLPDNPIAIESIHLLDQLVDFPRLWQDLVAAINVPITQAEEASPQALPGSDLYLLQQRLHSGTSEPVDLKGDGSLLVINGETAQDSATPTALLCQQRLATQPRHTLAILAEVRGDLLDEAMETCHLPRLGFGALSPFRPVFQVLPLACELLWQPLSPTALFQFLSHPVGPLPARVREPLAQLVAAVPGIGSDAWQQALTNCLEREDEAQREQLLANINYWLQSPRFSPHNGVDSATLAQRAGRVADWLQGARETSNDPALKALYFIALNQALEFVQAIQRLKDHGRETLTRDNVLRLIEDVRGSGAKVEDRQAQVAEGQPRALRANHAGAFTQPLDTVIWWDLQASDTVRRWPWTRGERTALAANGVHLQSEEQQLNWLAKAWLRPILHARQHCILVLHRDAARHHPVWDQISSLMRGLTPVNVNDSIKMSAIGLTYSRLAARPLPAKTRWWQLPAGTRLATREAESYSSLDAFLFSPYQWLLRYIARLRPGSLAAVTDGNLLRGNLAHRLFENFLNTHTDIAAIKLAQISGWVDDNLPDLLQQEGALLLMPGRQAECERFSIQLQDSLTSLVEHLQQARVVSVQMETPQEGSFTGGKLVGSIDLLATRQDKQQAVIDIKWGGEKYRRESLRDSNYLQLATYAQLRRSAGAPNPSLSYFIAINGQMLNLDHGFFPTAERITPDNNENWAELWQRFEHGWRWRRDQLERGLVEVTVTGTEPTADSQIDGEALLMPDTSDSFNDYHVLSGWESNA